VFYTISAQKELTKLATRDALTMRTKIDTVALTGEGDFRVLEGYENVFRLRAGRTRPEFVVVKTERTLTVIRVFYRQEGYRTKGRSRR
jgi:mRNA-degrading endonuclease RelE of RelBE toxin-antitoxin system